MSEPVGPSSPYESPEAGGGGGGYVTKPEDRIPFPQMVIYGTGAFVNNILAGAIGGMIIVLNLGLGMDPALVGLLGALPRITDAITDPLMGYISDNTSSRWGRRRPYILLGALFAGGIYALLWQMPRGYSEMFYFWYFLGGSILFYLAYTMFATPWVALGFELTPDYNERTRLMGVQNFIGQTAYLVTPWFLWFMAKEDWFKDQLQGASVLAVIVAVFVVIVGSLPAIFLNERQAEPTAPVPGAGAGPTFWDRILDFFRGFIQTLQSVPFRKLCIATFLVFNGFILISSFQAYVIIYYVAEGNQELGGAWVGWAGTVQGISTYVVITIVTLLATRIGKLRAFYVATALSMVGYALKWVCYDPGNAWLVVLPAPLMAFGLGGLFTLMPSMIADVVDLDEIDTGKRREGMYGSIFWWVVKVGMAAALAGGGFLLNATGFDVALEGNQAENTIFLMRVLDVAVPVLCSVIAIVAMSTYSITEKRALEIRDELESRRGVAQPVTT